MKQLIRLKEISLYHVAKTQTPDGNYEKTYTLQGTYKVIIEEPVDEISVEIYGADISTILRMSSVRRLLEKFLYTKLNNTSDNISKYEIDFNGNKYSIETLRKNYVDCKRL